MTLGRRQLTPYELQADQLVALKNDGRLAHRRSFARAHRAAQQRNHVRLVTYGPGWPNAVLYAYNHGALVAQGALHMN